MKKIFLAALTVLALVSGIVPAQAGASTALATQVTLQSGSGSGWSSGSYITEPAWGPPYNEFYITISYTGCSSTSGYFKTINQVYFAGVWQNTGDEQMMFGGPSESYTLRYSNNETYKQRIKLTVGPNSGCAWKYRIWEYA